MSAIQIFLLFALPGAILIASIVGIKILKRDSLSEKTALDDSADLNYDFSNVLKHPGRARAS